MTEFASIIEFANEMKRLRQDAGLTVKEVLAGYPDKRVTKMDYSRMERGICAFPPALAAHIRRLARAGEEPRAPLIAGCIPVGRKNAVRRQELRAVVRMSDRRMRKAIEDDRKAGYRICNEQDGSGYYIAADEAEWERFAAAQRARAMTILQSITG